MKMLDQFMEVAMAVCLWAVPGVMAAGASWPIFFPPRRVRSWPEWTRPLLGVLTAMGAVYVFLLGTVRPLIRVQLAAHRGSIVLDYPVDMLPLSLLLLGAVVVSYVVFFIWNCTGHHL